MISIISPAKTLDFDKARELNESTRPVLLSEAEKIMNALKKKSVKKLMEMQSISKNLAELNYERNQNWSAEHIKDQTKPALTAFKGDVYLGLEAESFDAGDDQFANEHLRILSGLYGILKPSDQILPYRLEMGTKMKTTRGNDLYAFWKNRVSDELAKEFENHTSKVLINLASDEYFKVIKPKSLNAEVVQPVFMDKKNGKYKVISFFAKKARGAMSRFIIRNKIDSPNDIKAFDTDGYLFHSEMSTDKKWVFARDQE